jgi:hypothetical protein
LVNFIGSLRKSLLILVLVTVVFPVHSALAMVKPPTTIDLPPLESFILQLYNGRSGELRGLYIDGLLAAQIIQQPAGSPEFVSPRYNIITQYASARRLGSIGLMAHNYLSGDSFFYLEMGQRIQLIYGDGQVSEYVVSEMNQYRAVDPLSANSRFINLGSGAELSASELFNNIYSRPGRVIFQTCISQGQDLNWGRLFVVAEPYASAP